MKMEPSVPKRRHINSRRRGITQKKAYNIKTRRKLEIKNSLLMLIHVCSPDTRAGRNGSNESNAVYGQPSTNEVVKLYKFPSVFLKIWLFMSP
jgi:hypothetical protein